MSEVKRFKIRHFDEIDGRHYESELVILASDHDRIVAELKAEVTRQTEWKEAFISLAEGEIPLNERWKQECLYRDQTIAKQAKVIEKLKTMVSHYETCATVDCYDDEEVDCDCGLAKELAAIERAEGEKE